ncbi:hypothetical protein ATCC90586_011403 [Pythium insidiosum]|nr:hypothetical protein ATCC90586_011403 [Pythium insidiosum]
MDTGSIKLTKPVSELAMTYTQPDDQNSAQADEQDDDDDDDDDDDFETPVTKRPQPPFNINLNPRATRPGRPKSSRAQDEADTRQSRQVP